MKNKVFVLFVAFLSFIVSVKAQKLVENKNETILLNNANSLIPLKRLDQFKIAVVVQDSATLAPFIQTIEKYAPVKVVGFNYFDENIKYFNTVIVAVKETEFDANCLEELKQATINNKQVILCQFSDKKNNKNGKIMANNAISELWAQNDAQGQTNMAMSIFGGSAITQGPFTTQQVRLEYVSNLPNKKVQQLTRQIDEIAEEAVRKHAAPGLMVMVVKQGQVIFEKAYGYHTYDKLLPTKTTDIFDLASVSKIAGTTPVIMHLVENKVVNLDSTMGYYLWQAKFSNKKNIKLRSVMLHEAGFTPFIPFYKNLAPGTLSRVYDAKHTLAVADSCYISSDYYTQVMWPEMLNSAVKPVGNYVYSDLSMYVMKEVAEHQTGVPMQDYIAQLLYKPLGMQRAGYLPRNRFSKDQIIPTEQDTSFRKVLLQGYVHDQGAAMAGGVAGHAGLFSTANDLAIYGQLLLNKGVYGGDRYFQSTTVNDFTTKQSLSSRRGLGFDRWDPDPKKEYPSKFANSTVFGHTGYTGTCIWVDPKNDLIYIFLSNRVHPQVSTKIYDLDTRSRIMDAIYTNLGY